MISLDPVAYFLSSSKEKADVQRQGSLAEDLLGVIRFLPGKNYEQALEDLEGMEKIWVLFWMDRVSGFKTKVQPPREVKKKGVFSTRSPHRPNPIGLSCVSLIKVSKLDVLIKDHDLLDGTPILDIKPYLPYADSFPLAKTGWIGPLVSMNSIVWRDLPLSQVAYLKEQGEVELFLKVEARLKAFTAPSSSNRVQLLGEGYYLEAYKSWRILFHKEESHIAILAVFSGYDVKTLQGLKTSIWEDLPLHRSFVRDFYSFFSETFVGKGWILYSAFKRKKEGPLWEVFLNEAL